MSPHGMVKILRNWILFWANNNFFSLKFKKTAFKMVSFWGFFVLGGIIVCKTG